MWELFVLACGVSIVFSITLLQRSLLPVNNPARPHNSDMPGFVVGSFTAVTLLATALFTTGWFVVAPAIMLGAAAVCTGRASRTARSATATSTTPPPAAPSSFWGDRTSDRRDRMTEDRIALLEEENRRLRESGRSSRSRRRATTEEEWEAAAADPRWFDGEEGELASFTYVDADGVVTDRRVRRWKSDGAYISAVCLERRAKRTFRKDRIGGWAAAD